MQGKAHVYKTIIKTLKNQIEKIKTGKDREERARAWIDNKAKGQQTSGKFINHTSKNT